MNKTHTILLKNRRGQVRTVTEDFYLRDDIGCGSHFCTQCTYFPPLKPILTDKPFEFKNQLIIQNANNQTNNDGFISFHFVLFFIFPFVLCIVLSHQISQIRKQKTFKKKQTNQHKSRKSIANDIFDP